MKYFNLYYILLLAILSFATFLLFYRLSDLMIFIGDQGWFYISARNMLLTGNTPLVGIASSHPWLHQGALWTYFLALPFLLFDFSPVSGAYLSSFLDIAAIFMMYKVGSVMFSKKLGLIAAVVYATSPLVIVNARMPYHTSPIPLLSILLFYLLYRWVQGNINFFPWIIFILALLYNFEIATSLFSLIVFLIFIYGFWKKTEWALGVFTKKIIAFSLLSFIVPMFPMLVYDFSYGFPQTLGFLAWIGYRILVLFGVHALHSSSSASLITMLSFLGEKLEQLIFPYNSLIALIVIFISIAYFLFKLLNKKGGNLLLLGLINFILFGGLFISKTPSDAYLSMLFPGLILLFAVFLDWVFDYLPLAGLLFLCVIIPFNTYFLILHEFSFEKYSISFVRRLSAAKYIVREAKGKEYNLEGRGVGSQFASFTMNYEYLTWWLGQSPSYSHQKLHFVIQEEKGKVIVKKYD